MLGLSQLSVLKSIFNKQSQPSGYTNHVSCSVLWRVPRCLIVHFSCTLPLLAYFISRMWLDFGDIRSSRFCLVSVPKFSVRILFANSMLSPFRFYASWASRSSKAWNDGRRQRRCWRGRKLSRSLSLWFVDKCFVLGHGVCFVLLRDFFFRTLPWSIWSIWDGYSK